MDEINEECGIAGVHFFDKEKNAAPLLYKMLLNLQNRGQLSCGISTYCEKRDALVKTYKDIGTVNEVFKTSDLEKTKKIFEEYNGNTGIGHVRYATFGLPIKDYAHPFERYHGKKCKWFSFCFNGNIANYIELKKKLNHLHFLP